MAEELGWTINGHHTSEYGLTLLDYSISSPEPITSYILVPGSRKPLDAASALFDQPTYDNRTITMRFFKSESPQVWHATESLMHNELLFHYCDIISDYEPECTWRGRVLSIKAEHVAWNVTEYELKASVEPRKVKTWNPGAQWLWDSFDFRTGIIQNLTNLTVKGSEDVKVGAVSETGVFNDVTMILTPTSHMSARIDGVLYDLPAGKSTWIQEVFIHAGEYIDIRLNGTGVVTIALREERL